MTNFYIEKTIFDTAFVINPCCAKDLRGSFLKIYEKDFYEASQLQFELSETFYTLSDKNVMRGLHFQYDNPQTKLIHVLYGAVIDVIVDIRVDSPTFAKWQLFELNDENKKVIYVPKGFAHGFFTLSNKAIMLYQCDGKYNKETDSGIIINDPDIGIQWPVSVEAAVKSDRDKKLMSLKEYINYKYM